MTERQIETLHYCISGLSNFNQQRATHLSVMTEGGPNGAKLKRILTIEPHHISNNNALIEPIDGDILYSGIIISLIQRFCASI